MMVQKLLRGVLVLTVTLTFVVTAGTTEAKQILLSIIYAVLRVQS